MNKYIIVALLTQLVFSASDLMGRYYMKRDGFTSATFLSGWFAAYFVIRTAAMFGQLYVFSGLELGRTMGVLASAAIVIANLLGLLLLKEVLSPTAYVGTALALTALILLALK